MRPARLAACALAMVVPSACARQAPAPARPAVDSGYVTVEGARLFYRSFGVGEAILVLHGGPGMDHSYLLPGMRGLASTHRVVLFDQRGGGRSEGAVTRETVSFDHFLADISAIADSLRLDRFVLLGHSWGGLPAMHYAHRHPDRLRALVLMNTVEPGRRYAVQSGDLLLRKRTTADSAEFTQLLRSDAFRRRDSSAVNALLRSTFRTLFTDRSLASQLNLHLSQRTVSNMSTVASLVMQSASSDFWSGVAGIRVPTLIVQGADDAMPLDMPRELARTIPGAQLVIVENAGHFPYIEKPHETFAAIRAFLQSR